MLRWLSCCYLNERPQDYLKEVSVCAQSGSPPPLRCVCLLSLRPALAQQTTGIIIGRMLDDQEAAIPGATVIGH